MGETAWVRRGRKGGMSASAFFCQYTTETAEKTSGQVPEGGARGRLGAEHNVLAVLRAPGRARGYLECPKE